jgi:hypothetical protein
VGELVAADRAELDKAEEEYRSYPYIAAQLARVELMRKNKAKAARDAKTAPHGKE